MRGIAGVGEREGEDVGMRVGRGRGGCTVRGRGRVREGVVEGSGRG